ncbi:hypothetical protein AHAT_06540 [Agarivorans sp. Toyoura001]|uniref:tetratricopeptide repeat-containing sulfotransferase family protein n=1 Tax=Agarivorans sp. Toyoura001 TaxID=2283141 RepID=UPI0010D3587C|nr:sulfotransferase [Agarivorans sp. Toyoura001]GDY24764.1 hypothetical protein AHAT_06540 [Agarivorans sp. Toyoura001]
MKPEQRHSIMEKAVKALQAGKYSQAISTVNKINKLKSQQDYKSLELEAYALFHMQKLEKSLESYQQLLGFCQDNEQRNSTYRNIAKTQKTLGLTRVAISSFEQCFSLDNSINNAPIAAQLGECYLDEDCYGELDKLTALMQSWPGYYAPAQALLISAAKKQGNKQLALERINAFLAHSSFIEEWQLEFAIDTLMFIREHQSAIKILKQAEIDFVNKPWIRYYQAEVKARQGEHESVTLLLSDELIERLDFMRQKAAYKLRAEAFDKQQRYSDAFIDFTAMANLNHQRAQASSHTDNVASLQKLDLSFLHNVKNIHTKEHQPVFMMGFNRSGTTLLENILDTQEQVIALSETRSLFNVTEAFSYKLNKRYPQDLPKLNEQDLNILHQEYFDYFTHNGIQLKDNSVVVDKFPLYTIDLPLILSLFPKAKIIFCLRHPADTCLSNFQQNSANNQQQAKLNRLEDCFKRYQQVFTLFQRYQTELDLNIHFVRYEDLVSDLEKEAKKVFEFLEIDANNDYLNFNQHAKQKVVMSASSNQVVKPIYTESCYKWRNYQEFITPHLAMVKPFIKAFGYSD